jgi:hypothetical protein
MNVFKSKLSLSNPWTPVYLNGGWEQPRSMIFRTTKELIMNAFQIHVPASEQLIPAAKDPDNFEIVEYFVSCLD